MSKNIEDKDSDSDSVTSLNLEKKIYPVYNENNFYITKEIIQSILQKGNINKPINNISLWQQAFIHKSYCENNDFK